MQKNPEKNNKNRDFGYVSFNIDKHRESAKRKGHKNGTNYVYAFCEKSIKIRKNQVELNKKAKNDREEIKGNKREFERTETGFLFCFCTPPLF
jgi:hypothetical protein